MSTSGSNDLNGFAGEYWSRNALSTVASVKRRSQPLEPVVQPLSLDHRQNHRPDARSRQGRMMAG